MLLVGFLSFSIVWHNHASAAPARPEVNALADEYSQQGLAIFYAEEKKVALLFLGTSHTFDPENFQIIAIEKFIKEFKPTVMLIEGGEWPIADSKVQAVKQFSEFGLARWHANQLQIRNYTFEPTLADEMTAVLAKHDPIDAKLFYALRMVPQWAAVGNSQSVEQKMQRFLSKEKALANFGLKDVANAAPQNLAELNQLVANRLPGLKDWRTIDFAYSNPGLKETFFHKIKLTSGSFRNRALEKAIFVEFGKGERVMVLAGGMHLSGVLNNVLNKLNIYN